MGRKRQHHQDLPRHIYVRRSKYMVRFKPDAAGKRKTKLFYTLDEALRAWAAEYGEDISKSDRIKHIAARYRAGPMAELAAKTRKEYGRILDKKILPLFGDWRIVELKAADVAEYRDHGYNVLKKRPATNRELAVLSAVCQFATDSRLVERNVCREVKRKKEDPRARYVEDWEVEAVMGLARSDYMRKAIILTGITGMRLGDIMRLGPDNIRPDGFFYVMGKTKRPMLFEWSDTLRECAVRPPVSYEGFTTAFRRLMDRAIKTGAIKERFTFHDLRAKAGSDADDWRILGHRDRATFERIYNRKPIHIKQPAKEPTADDIRAQIAELTAKLERLEDKERGPG